MKTNKLTAEEMVIADRLKQMKMSGMAEAYEEQLLNPNSDLVSFQDRFSAIINFEWELRFNKKFNRFLKKATLRYPHASFDETIYEPDRMLDTETIELLSTCKWLDEGRNLLITGATGAGKSYISNALCIAAIRQFKTVKYIRANTMMSEMDQSRIKGTYLDYVNHMARLDMLVIDDFGLMDLDLDKCRDFFEVIDSRDNQKSTVIVSQLPVKSWYDLFADNTYADACLDRIIHKAFRLELNGKNMRIPLERNSLPAKACRLFRSSGIRNSEWLISPDANNNEPYTH